MKGLFLNDLYHIRKRFILIFILSFILSCALLFVPEEFGVVKTLLVGTYLCSLTSAVLPGLCSIDETEKWTAYSMTFPISRKTYVSEKYALGLMMSLFSGILLSFVPLINMLRLSMFSIESYAFSTAVILAVSFLLLSLSFPIIFKFGSAKAYIFFILVGLIYGGSFSLMSDDNLVLSIHLESVPIWISVLVIFISLLMYALSWKLSVRFYQKREL